MAQLWICLRLPHLSLYGLKLDYRNGSRNVCVHQHRIWDVSADLTQQKTLSTGMPASAAQQLGDCHIHNVDLDANQKALDQLCQGLYQFTPYIEPYITVGVHRIQHYAITLEISRSLKLFKGLAPLVSLLKHFLESEGHDFQLGFGHSPACAWLLAGTPHPALNTLETQPVHTWLELLAPLPIERLNHYPKDYSSLKKMGFHTLGRLFKQIKAQGLSPIYTRLSSDFVTFLQALLAIDLHSGQALLQAPTPALAESHNFCRSIHLDTPLLDLQWLAHPIQELLEALTQYLIRHQYHTQTITWCFYDIYRQTHEVNIHLAHCHSQWQQALALTQIHLEGQPPPFEVDTIELRCSHTFPLEQTRVHLSLFDDINTVKHDDALTHITAKLRARVGADNVYKLDIANSHLPEDSQQILAIEGTSKAPLEYLAKQPRPDWILPEPQKISQRQQRLYWLGYLSLIQGPERFETHWWNTPVKRDYFIARRDDFCRLWVYQDRQTGDWFVQGVFA